jgi:hypothetical protein
MWNPNPERRHSRIAAAIRDTIVSRTTGNTARNAFIPGLASGVRIKNAPTVGGPNPNPPRKWRAVTVVALQPTAGRYGCAPLCPGLASGVRNCEERHRQDTHSRFTDWNQTPFVSTIRSHLATATLVFAPPTSAGYGVAPRLISERHGTHGKALLAPIRFRGGDSERLRAHTIDT